MTTADDREQAWDELHAATPPDWWVGTPSYVEGYDGWVVYAYDQSEGREMGKRKREWTAVAPTEEEVVREMARCLREIHDGTLRPEDYAEGRRRSNVRHRMYPEKYPGDAGWVQLGCPLAVLIFIVIAAVVLLIIFPPFRF